MPRIHSFSTTWREGRYFDRWMIVHILSGFAGALSNVFFGLSTRGVLVLGVSLLVVWEVVEYVAGVRETASNRIIDVVVGLLGILAALWLAARLDYRGELVAFGIAAAVTAAFATAGWIAYRRRARQKSAQASS